jgi:hypothetical protein
MSAIGLDHIPVTSRRSSITYGACPVQSNDCIRISRMTPRGRGISARTVGRCSCGQARLTWMSALLCALTLLLALPSLSAAAPIDGGALTSETPVNGAVSTTEGIAYTFTAVAGDHVTLAVTNPHVEGELEMKVLDSSGAEDAGAVTITSSPADINFTPSAAEAGTTTVVITSHRPSIYSGYSTGTFTLTYEPTAAHPTAAHPPTASLALASLTANVTSHGMFAIDVTCSGSPCSGTLRVTAREKKTTGRGRHKKTKVTSVTIGMASFSGLSVGTHSILLKLSSTGVRLLKQDHYRLSATAQVAYTSGGAVETVRGNVSLKGTKPGKSKRHRKGTRPIG